MRWKRICSVIFGRVLCIGWAGYLFVVISNLSGLSQRFSSFFMPAPAGLLMKRREKWLVLALFPREPLATFSFWGPHFLPTSVIHHFLRKTELSQKMGLKTKNYPPPLSFFEKSRKNKKATSKQIPQTLMPKVFPLNVRRVSRSGLTLS